MNKSDLIVALAARSRLSKADAGRAVEALFAPTGVIVAELRRNGTVHISGFGHFETRKREARTGRDPRTGKEIQIKASVAAAFRPGKGLRDAVARKSR